MTRRSAVALLVALVLGALFACWLYGWRVLDPASHAWLLYGDPAQHYLGSVYFLGEPWHWPPGAISGFGSATTSIILSDSIPLLALAAKLLHVPAGWQYFGLWLLACHALMAAAGAALLQRLGCRWPHAALGALFFTAAPALLLRAYGHEALQGQFLVVAALALALGPWRGWPWPLLVMAAVGVHPYLAAMVAAIATAAAGAAYGERRLDWRTLMCGSLLLLLAAAGTAYLAGYFVGSSQFSAVGQGYFSANLLTWFDPMDWAGFLAHFGRDVAQGREWSRLLPVLGQATAGQYEGFAYQGAGMLALLAAALITAVARMPPQAFAVATPSRRQWACLLAACGSLALLAVSARVTLGTRVLFELPLGDTAQRLLGLFRASGRFVWPMTYLLMAWAIARVARLPGGLLWLLAGLLLQAYDLSDKFSELRDRFRHGPPGVVAAPASPLWGELLGVCPRVELLLWPADDQRWITPGLAAAQVGVPVTPVLIARPLPEAEAQQRRALAERRAGLGWRADTVYVAPHEAVEAGAAAGPGALRVDPPPGFVRHLVDGFDLFVPTRCPPPPAPLSRPPGVAPWA
ncbi:DUF6311 domain-containing protein [Immundisolibacter sp.]